MYLTKVVLNGISSLHGSRSCSIRNRLLMSSICQHLFDTLDKSEKGSKYQLCFRYDKIWFKHVENC